MRNDERRRSSYLKMKKMVQELDDPSTNPSKFLRGRENLKWMSVGWEFGRVREERRKRKIVICF